MRRSGVWLAAFAALWAGGQAAASQNRDPGARNFSTYTPRAEAVRIDHEDAPIIDGDLSDAAWRKALPIEQFFQVEPAEGATPSQATRAYILYDERNLYVAVYNYDTEPNRIRRSQMQRDPSFGDDDAVRIYLDTFGSFRDGYFFAMNPNGARGDGLIENGSNNQDQWNTIWRGNASVVEDGWVAEFAIPFQSISFDPALDEWNFQIVRTIARNNEEIRWSNIDRSRYRLDLTNPGRLSGIRDVNNGIGLEVQAYATGSAVYDWRTNDTNYDFQPSGNAFYKITPSLTGSLTVNTDFSDTQLDDRQVNTGRFSLFFPETRDFFLQDAQAFAFGGTIFDDGPSNGLPFFSRNIGIVDGTPVDLKAGAKLSGKLGPATVGMISARTGASEELGVDGQQLSTARISVPVLAESKAGVIYTHGDPTGETTSHVAGADFQFKRSNIIGNGTVTADTAYIQSFADGERGHMAAHQTVYTSPTWNTTVRLRDISENYAPAMGFANRTGIRKYNAKLFRLFRPQDSYIREAELGTWSDLITDRDGLRLDHYYGLWAEAENNPGDEIHVEFRRHYENILRPFTIAGTAPVPAGEYQWDQYRVQLSATNARRIGGEVDIEWGGAYDGDFISVESELSLRPSRFLEIAAEYEYQQFDLPQGAVDIHVASINSVVAFTPDMIIKTEVQYDNISEAFTFFSRFSWEPVPEREIFLSFGHTALIEPETFPREFVSRRSSLALRLGHTFRM